MSSITPCPSSPPLSSPLIRNPPDAIPPINDLKALKATGESKRQMKEKDRGEALAIEKARKNGAYMLSASGDDRQLSVPSVSSIEFDDGATHVVNDTSPSQSSSDPQSLKSNVLGEKKRKGDDGSDVQPAHKKYKSAPSRLQSLRRSRNTLDATVSLSFTMASQPIAAPDRSLPPQNLFVEKPSVLTPPLPGPSKPMDITGGFGRSKQPLTKREDTSFHESNGDEAVPLVVPKFGQPEYNEEKQLDIQEIPNNTPNEYLDTVEHTTSVAPVGSGGTTTTPVSQSACWRLSKRAFTPDELLPLIETIFSSTDEGDLVRCLRGDDAQTFIDVMDEAIDNLNFSARVRRKGLKVVYNMCGRNRILPKSLRIPLCYDRQVFPLYSGGFADVWKGEHRGRDVAVKVIRTPSSTDLQNLQKIIGRFCKEVVIWKSLRHPNVLPLMGVTMTETHFAMVSEWMVNGNIKEFMKAHPDEDRLGLLRDVAGGLVYIHSQGMIHGDLKGANILIDQTRHACLADFSLLTIVSDPTSYLFSTSLTQGGTVRWMSPELIDPQRFGFENGRPTRSSDCYALGMVIYETISGHFPFRKDTDVTVLMKVLNGERPSREALFTDNLWKMLERCWEPQPDARPSIEDVLQCLGMEAGMEMSPGLLNVEIDDDDDWSSMNDSSEISPPSGGLNTVKGGSNRDDPQTVK